MRARTASYLQCPTERLGSNICWRNKWMKDCCHRHGKCLGGGRAMKRHKQLGNKGFHWVSLSWVSPAEATLNNHLQSWLWADFSLKKRRDVLQGQRESVQIYVFVWLKLLDILRRSMPPIIEKTQPSVCICSATEKWSRSGLQDRPDFVGTHRVP